MDLSQEQWWAQAQEDENAVILDVRTEDEVNRGQIPGAKNIDIYKDKDLFMKLKNSTSRRIIMCIAKLECEAQRLATL